MRGGFLAALIVALPLMAQAQDLRIGVKEDIPYFGYYNEKGERAGVDVDLGKAIANHLGMTPRFVSLTSEERIPALEQHRVDLVIGTFSITPERKRHVLFSVPYYTDGQRVMVMGKSGIQSLSDLAGRKVGVVEGATSGPNLAKAQPKAKLVRFHSYYEAYMGLLFGQVEAISSDGVVLRGLQAIGEGAATELKQREGKPPVFYVNLANYKPGDRFRILDAVLSREEYGIAASGESASLIAKINQYLQSREGRESLAAIKAKYLGRRRK